MDFFTSDNGLHIGISYGLSAVAFSSLYIRGLNKNKAALLSGAFVLGIGLTKEIVDPYFGHNREMINDMSYNAAGVFVSEALSYSLTYAKEYVGRKFFNRE